MLRGDATVKAGLIAAKAPLEQQTGTHRRQEMKP